MKIRIVIADDHPVVLGGISKALRDQGDFKIVGEASNGEEAVELCEKHRPELALVDLSMPDISGLEAMRRIREISPETLLAVISMHNEVEYVRSVFQFGINGFIHKNEPLTEYPKILKTILDGKTYISPEVSHHMVSLLNVHKEEKSILSNREKEVLQYIALGMTSKEIGEKLTLSQRTIDTHRTNMMRKLGIQNKAGLIRYALTNNLDKIHKESLL